MNQIDASGAVGMKKMLFVWQDEETANVKLFALSFRIEIQRITNEKASVWAIMHKP